MVRKYIRHCKQLFPVYGKYERQFLKRLRNEVNEYTTQHPSLTYDELITQFGSPKDIVVGYYETVDDDYLLKKTNLVKTVRRFLIIAMVLAVSYIGYRSYMIYRIRIEAQEPIILYKEESIETVDPADENSDATANDSNSAN